jgi:ABC-type multidrug transport system ATPase subunit
VTPLCSFAVPFASLLANPSIVVDGRAGKSSLLNAIARFKVPGLVASGSVFETDDSGDCTQGSVAYVHHDYKVMLFEELTGLENLMTGALVRMKNFRSDDASSVQTMRVLVEGMKLQRCLGTEVKNMSSGEKRRLSIAVECLKPSRVMLLDEPLSGLDSSVALETVVMLKYICQRFQKIMLFSVHQASQEVFEEIDDLIVMKRGKCVYSGPRISALEQLGADVKSTLANPSDLLMEHVMSMEDFSQLQEIDRVSEDTSININGTTQYKEDGVSELAPFSHRFLACVIVSWLNLRDHTLLWILFLVVPLTILVAAAYNIGRDTAPQEAIVLIFVLSSAPPCLFLQTTATSRSWRLLSFTNMKRFGLYSGIEYSIQLILFYILLASVMTLIVYSTSLLLGLIEIMTIARMLELLAVAFALQWTVVVFVITLNLFVSKPGVADHEFHAVNMGADAALLVFLALGLVFSGLLYRTGTSGIPYVYDILSRLSPAYWGGLAMMVTILDKTIFPGCVEDSNYSLLCLGDTYLLNYGLDSRPYVPGFSIWVLLLMSSLSFPVAVMFGYRPWEKRLQFVDSVSIDCDLVI